MNETILIGRGHKLTSIQRSQWQDQLRKVPQSMKTRLGFMTPEHHLVRYFVVRMLPRIGKPLPTETIAARLKLSLRKVNSILAELEERLFFFGARRERKRFLGLSGYDSQNASSVVFQHRRTDLRSLS